MVAESVAFKRGGRLALFLGPHRVSSEGDDVRRPGRPTWVRAVAGLAGGALDGMTTPARGGFKAALYAYRANHGQFNTVWGRGDQGPWSGGLLNLHPLETAEEQQDVARTAISAFLEVSLHDAAGYRAFFRRPMAGREWLPEDVCLVRSDDGSRAPLVDLAGRGGSAATLVTVSDGLRSARGVAAPAARAAGHPGRPGGDAGVGGRAGAGGVGRRRPRRGRRSRADARPEIRLALANASVPAAGGPGSPGPRPVR